MDVGDDREDAVVLVVDRREEIELEPGKLDVEQRLVDDHVSGAVIPERVPAERDDPRGWWAKTARHRRVFLDELAKRARQEADRVGRELRRERRSDRQTEQ